MGNESSLTKDCKLEKEVSVSSKTWRLYQARRKDGSRVSVFVYEPHKQNGQYIENAAKYLKVLRHPAIMKFHGLENTSDGVWMATEQVTPLENVLEDLSSAEVVAGLYNILDALIFLHERGGLCHNNVALSSLFVSDDGSWRLGGVEYLCRFDQASPAYLTKCKGFRDEKSLSPEEKAGKINSMDCGWARDVYSFGVLMESLLECVTDLGDLTKTIEIRVQDECLNPEPNRRPKLSSLVEDQLFRNDFLQIVIFLKNLTLQSEDEKQEFFSDITEKLYNLPVDLLASRLVRPLLSRFVLLDATACDCLMPHLLTPYQGDRRPEYCDGEVNPLLPEKLFRKYVVPELFKIFHVRDTHIRLILLEHFCCYVTQFEKDVLVRNILPQILLGLRDSNDELVKMSLHALAHLVPRLGGDVVIGANRIKLFSEATPKFSANTKQAVVAAAGLKAATDDVINADTATLDSDKQLLKDVSRAAEREKRREQAKLRNEERRKHRLQQEKQQGDVPLTVMGRSRSEEMEKSGGESTPLDNIDLNESDIDREIEDELESMETTVSMETKQHRSGLYDNHIKSTSTGALKLKSSKMRTSPPPIKKLDYDFDKRSVNDTSETAESRSRSNVNSTAEDWSRVEEAETWADGGDDDQWNSPDWADINMESSKSQVEEVSKASHSKSDISSPFAKQTHSQSDLASSPRTSKGGMSIKGNSQSAVDSPTSGQGGMSIKGNSQSAIDSPKSGQGGMSIKGNSQSVSAKKPVNPPKPRVVDVDIMSLDIKTSGNMGKSKPKNEQSEDFFADMQPTIKVDPHSLWGILNTGSSADRGQAEGSKVKSNSSGRNDSEDYGSKAMNFAVTSTEQIVGEDAWGAEDLDWGQDDL